MRNKMKRRSKKPTCAVPSPAPAARPAVWRDSVWLALGVLVCCGVFIGKAYNMDDPLVVWTAQRIAAHPADFYGFDVNWYGYATPMLQTDLNPPGAAYYYALFGMLGHWHESALHASGALLAIALILGIYGLARQLGGHPPLAALLALVCPGVFVSMGTVMTDLPMTALWVCSVVLWIRGLDAARPGANAAAGLLIGLAALTKFFALSLVPLLLVYTLCSERRRWVRLAWLILPLAIIGAYELYTQRLYGVGQMRGIVGLAEQYYEIYTVHHGRKLLTALTFLGAGAAPALLLAPWLWRRTERSILWMVVLGAVLITAVLQLSGWQVAETPVVFRGWFWAQYGLWLLAGMHILALLAAELWSQRDRASLLLGLWIGGTLFYCVGVNHLVNMRVMLPALPAVALLCVRRFCRLRAARATAASVWAKPVRAALAAGLVLSLCAAWADMSLANSARQAAAMIAPERRSGTTWFSGHWGFQYYMEARGARPIDVKHQTFRRGDTVVTPENATNRFLARPRVASTDQSFEVPVCGWVTTMRAECGAGFHADLWGPLPFVFGPVPAERYQVIVLGRH